MFEAIKRYLRKTCLKKQQSKLTTAILPMRELNSAITFIDAEDPSFNLCKEKISDFYKENNLIGKIFFFDLRKLEKEQPYKTNVEETVIRGDLNWYDKPRGEKIDRMLFDSYDVLISLVNRNDFPLEFMTRCTNAKFKIGRQQINGTAFDLVITAPSDKRVTGAESFEAMREFLTMIK